MEQAEHITVVVVQIIFGVKPLNQCLQFGGNISKPVVK